MSRIIKAAILFKSSTNPARTYEVLLHTNGTMSCSCAGWCRRVAADGSRTCRHIVLVQTNRFVGDETFIAETRYDGSVDAMPVKANIQKLKEQVKKVISKEEHAYGKRKIIK
jgi:hypothetical protein